LERKCRFSRMLAVIMLAAAPFAAVFVGCASVSGSLPTAEELADRAVLPAGAEVSALARGRALAVTKCTGCHRFYWPYEYAPQRWSRIARKMSKLASLSERQTDDLEAYFLAASRAARESASADRPKHSGAGRG